MSTVTSVAGSMPQTVPARVSPSVTQTIVALSSADPGAYWSGVAGRVMALPVPLKLLSATKVDPSIGQNALNMMLTAGVVAAVAIAIFMLVYYEFPGLVAVVALGLYILFTLTAPTRLP